MKAAVLTGIREMELHEVPGPAEPGPGEVLLKTEVVGVCGSDIHYYVDGRIGEQVVRYPYRVGHEYSARVVKLGEGVDHRQEGALVAVDPAMSCGFCSQCRAGRAHTCEHLRFLGCPGQAEGCLSEYTVMPAACCFPVPSGMNEEVAALVEPLSIGLYAHRLSGGVEGKTVAILGCGPIGMCVLMPAVVRGAPAVYVTDKIPERLQAAGQAGAVWTGNPLTDDVAAEILRREPEGVDLAFECCGQQDALDDAVRILKPGGMLLVIGIPAVQRVSFDVDAMRRKELRILNVRRQNDCVEEAIRFAAENRQVEAMVTHRFELPNSKQAFDLVADYRDGVMKAVIRF
ncbi:MAG TPA: hypothetical protein ENO24_08405 [Chloroflexi bacterium]|nr:hypothetical protein [Chloroflexota bacterium]